MEVQDYINTIITNSFSDWVRCHNDMLHNGVSIDTHMSEELSDKEIKMISFILKVLYNDKISTINKYYLLISIEENLEYFVRTENGAINLVQTLVSDLRNSLTSKWDSRYMCQLIIVICSASVHYDLALSSRQQCSTIIQGLLLTMMDIISIDNTTTNWVNLKHTVLTSMLHFESTYPTLLSKYESRLAEIVQKEKCIYFELLLQIYSLVFMNNIMNRCRLLQNVGYANLLSLETQVFDKDEMLSFVSWRQSSDIEEKIVGSQSNILKILKGILEQAMDYLSPLAINSVVRNCLLVTNCLPQNNLLLWTPFITRFISTLNLSILEVLLVLKVAYKSWSVKEDIVLEGQLQETLLSFLNNCRLFLPKRQIVAQWLYTYPVEEQIVNTIVVGADLTESFNILLEPELIKHIYLRSVDVLEIKYCKLMLLNRMLRTSKKSDCNSVLLFSSLKEVIKSIHYFDSDMPSNILLRVMFAMHIRHPYSALARDFESILANLVDRYPTILSAVMFYLNGLEKYLMENEESQNFFMRCLVQFSKSSSHKLSLSTNNVDFTSVKLHIQILNYAVRFSDIDMTEYLSVLHHLLSSSKMNSNMWLEEAYDLVLNLCFDIIQKYGSSKFYQELTDILNEIRNELFGNVSEIKANFLYALIVSLPSKKVKEIMFNKKFDEINDKDFQIIESSLIESYQDEYMLLLHRQKSASTLQKARYQYDSDLEGYLTFLMNHDFIIVFDVELSLKKEFKIENIIYGIGIEFQTDCYFADITPWNIAFIRCEGDDGFSIKGSLDVTIKEPETFSICATLAATKLDGTFIILAVRPEKIDLMDLALTVPIDFFSEDYKNTFVTDLHKNRLIVWSFVSVNFDSEVKLKRFNDSFNKFFLFKVDDCDIYLAFLPPRHHILFKCTVFSTFRRRFDIYTDLKTINLIAIEEYLKNFEI